MRPRHTSLIHLGAIASVTVLLAGCGDDGTSPTPNTAPRIAAQGDTAVAVGDTLRLRASAEDDDGDALTFGVSIVISLDELEKGYFPDGGIDDVTGDFRFSPVDADRPGRDISFTVRDGRGGVDETEFHVRVD